jgi:hypothetical protein
LKRHRNNINKFDVTMSFRYHSNFVVSISIRCYCDIVMISLRYSFKSERYRRAMSLRFVVSTSFRCYYDIDMISLRYSLKSERYRRAMSLRFIVSTSFRCYCDIVMISLRYSLNPNGIAAIWFTCRSENFFYA